jgi:hypothetical protein
VTGAHKALVELHHQVGIVNSEVCADTLKDYRALILSDQRILSGREADAIRAFVRNGGALIATHGTGTWDVENRALADFALADMLGVRYLGSSKTSNCYLRTTPEMKAFGIPTMDVEAGGSYTRIATTSARKLLDIVPPYRGGPPDTSAEGPGVTIAIYGKGKALYCASDRFSGFFEKATPNMRKLADWMLGLVYPVGARLISLERAPVTVELFYNKRGNERFVHLVNWCGDKRDIGTPQVQDFPAVHGMRVRVRLGERPKEVSLLPEGGKVDFTYTGGWLAFDALPLRIHDVYHVAL